MASLRKKKNMAKTGLSSWSSKLEQLRVDVVEEKIILYKIENSYSLAKN